MYGWSGGGLRETPGKPAGSRVLTETKGQAEERLQHVAEKYLDGVDRHFFLRGVHKKVIIGDDPASEIMNYARQERIDVIAIATHGRTGLGRLVMGSVTTKLLDSRVAPLLLVRPGRLHEED